eukprot:tig00000441_g704.t1
MIRSSAPGGAPHVTASVRAPVDRTPERAAPQPPSRAESSADAARRSFAGSAAALAAALVVASSFAGGLAASAAEELSSGAFNETRENYMNRAEKQRQLRQKPPADQKKNLKCVDQCLWACTRLDELQGGSPRTPVALKSGYRSRQYCLLRCQEGCSELDSDARGALDGDAARFLQARPKAR